MLAELVGMHLEELDGASFEGEAYAELDAEEGEQCGGSTAPPPCDPPPGLPSSIAGAVGEGLAEGHLEVELAAWPEGET